MVEFVVPVMDVMLAAKKSSVAIAVVEKSVSVVVNNAVPVDKEIPEVLIVSVFCGDAVPEAVFQN
jgi:hypothetical protein